MEMEGREPPLGRGAEPLASVRVERRDSIIVACIVGEIDTSNVSDVERMLQAGVSARAMGLVVDLTGVSYLNSATIKMLFGLSEHLRVHNQQLRIAIADAAPMRAILSLVKFERIVPLHPTVDDAQAGIVLSRGKDARA